VVLFRMISHHYPIIRSNIRVNELISVDYLGWLSFMSTLEESPVANSGSTKVWVMDPILFDV
jgi:hypothetical protein